MNEQTQTEVEDQREGVCEHGCEHGYVSHCPNCHRDHMLRQMHISRLNQYNNIPLRFKTKTLADYHVTSDGEESALSTARSYVENFADHLAAGRCLIFCGRPGTGKTHLACAIAKSLIQKEQTVSYVTVAEVIRTIRDTWHRDSRETTNSVLQRLRAFDLLVLDEVGVQFGSDGELTQLTEVLDLRYRDVRPTLVVSNCKADELKQYLGDRGYDRLRENGGKVVVFDWPSRRGLCPSSVVERKSF